MRRARAPRIGTSPGRTHILWAGLRFSAVVNDSRRPSPSSRPSPDGGSRDDGDGCDDHHFLLRRIPNGISHRGRLGLRALQPTTAHIHERCWTARAGRLLGDGLQIPRLSSTDAATGAPSQATAQHDPPLLVALTRAFYWQQLLEDGLVGSGSEIAKRERLHHSTVNELLRLTLLEPAIIQAIVAGRQPRCMSLIWFQRNPLPLGWVEQRRVLEAFDR